MANMTTCFLKKYYSFFFSLCYAFIMCEIQIHIENKDNKVTNAKKTLSQASTAKC